MITPCKNILLNCNKKNVDEANCTAGNYKMHFGAPKEVHVKRNVPLISSLFFDIQIGQGKISVNEFVVLNENNKYPENYFVLATSLANITLHLCV
jgi:hypothetical protein